MWTGLCQVFEMQQIYFGVNPWTLSQETFASLLTEWKKQFQAQSAGGGREGTRAWQNLFLKAEMSLQGHVFTMWAWLTASGPLLRKLLSFRIYLPGTKHEKWSMHRLWSQTVIEFSPGRKSTSLVAQGSNSALTSLGLGWFNSTRNHKSICWLWFLTDPVT